MFNFSRKKKNSPDTKGSHKKTGSPAKKNTKNNRSAFGLDIGTNSIVLAYQNGKGVQTKSEANAYIKVLSEPTTKKLLIKKGITFFEKGNMIYVLGNSATNFANVIGSDLIKPIENGFINLKEVESVDAIKGILNKLFNTSGREDTKVFYNIPGALANCPDAVISNESIIKAHLQTLGFCTKPINEGMAVVVSELAEHDNTGIGISIGAGMCNVCFSYLSIPIIDFSLQKGGDYIDKMVANTVGQDCKMIKEFKETDLDLSIEPRTNVETAFHLYYDDLFNTVIQNLSKVMGTSKNIPRFSIPIPIVLSGGAVLSKGSCEKFTRALKSVQMPVEISEIILAEQPLHSTAKGALLTALAE